MSLLDAVRTAGVMPPLAATQATKKRYSEILSRALAEELADGLRQSGFRNVKPFRGQPGEKAFQGGLGPKRVDVSYSDDRHGLMLAGSIKTICFEPFGKNLKNRFGDLCTEAITLHMRFPYAVVCALFAMPEAADLDLTHLRPVSTFERARLLLGTVAERMDYSSAGERFEDVTLLLFRPMNAADATPVVRLFTAGPHHGIRRELSEAEYLSRLRELYNLRNPHAQIGIEAIGEEDDS